MDVFAINHPGRSYASDGAIVNSFTLRPGGMLTEEGRRRADKAIELYHHGETQKLLMTGCADERDFFYSRMTQSEAFARYAAEHGVPSHDIAVDHVQLALRKMDTVGALYRWWLVGPRRLHVVTSDYHAPRAREIMEFIRGRGGEVAYVPALTDDLANPDDAMLRNALAAAESGKIAVFRDFFAGVAPGDLRAIGERLEQSHPYYNNGVRIMDGINS